MGGFVNGDIVVLNFPFSDLSGTKRRPALILSEFLGNDIFYAKLLAPKLKMFLLFQLKRMIISRES